MNRDWNSLAFAIALAAGGQPALADWQCLSPGATVPAAAQAASDYLGRAESIYSEQLLGVLRTGGHVYLVNSRDDGWSERVRLGLMELRLAEPDITAARRFQAALSSGPAPDASGIPAGEFACLARERAARQGLVFRGEAILLAAGKAVHLVDPMELGIVVEVRAVGDRPLDLREIIATSARQGIYAGLIRGRGQRGAVMAARSLEDTVTIPVGPAGRPDGEVVISARTDMMVASIETASAADAPSVQVSAPIPAAPAPVPAPVLAAPAPPVQAPTVVVAAPAPPAQAPATVQAVTAPPVVVEPPARVARVEVPAAPSPVKPVAPDAVVVAVAEPVSIVAPVEAPTALETQLVVRAAPAPPAAEEPPVRVARVDVPAAPPPGKPLPPVAPAAEAVAIAEPVLIAARVSAPAVQASRGAAEKSYEDYTKMMKEQLALRRSGAVRSISEMTYVHPAVEYLRASR